MEQTLFRASSLGKLMTNAKTKTGLSETCKSALLDIYLREKYSRTNDISNKYIEKGLAVENDAIDVWRRDRNAIVFKNEINFKNDLYQAHPICLSKMQQVNASMCRTSKAVGTYTPSQMPG